MHYKTSRMHYKTILDLIEMERRKIGSLRLLLIFPFSAFLTYVPNISFAADSFYQSSCFNKGSFTDGSTYQANLDSLFSHLSSTTNIYYGFCNTYFGKKPDLVTAIGLCRGDQSQNTCRSCLKQTMSELEQSCPTSLEAVGWSEFCMLHYANQEIYGKLTTGPHLGLYFGDKSDGDQFNTRLNSLLNNLINLAAGGGPLVKYAVHNVAGINALEQCSPDLSQKDCSDCLTTAIGKIPDLCNGMTGCRIVTPSCNLRYQTEPFSEALTNISSSSLQPSDIIRPSSLPSASSGEGKTKNRTTIIIAIATGVSVLSILFLIYLKSRKREPRENVKIEQHKNIYSYSKISQSQTYPEDEPLAFDIEAIRTATNNFSDENKLGQGGFGPVYKGLLPNGQFVAVKRLASCSGQGESEFTNEIALMANLQHHNLVKLLGYCLDLEGNERILIYEFVTNKSLDRFIFDPNKRTELDWATRYKIIEGLAQGLLYLHEESRLKIIHRDLKASNILLDKDMNPKIADFGLARLFSDDQTHVTMSRVPGTYGYMAPEYLYHRRCSVKSDIFSFGVLILEIISGQRNIMFDGKHEVDIRSVVWRNWMDRTPLNIVDPNLMREGSTSNQMMRCIHIGLLCVQKIAQQRPETGRIVKMLKTHETLPIPSQPSILYTDNNAIESEIELS